MVNDVPRPWFAVTGVYLYSLFHINHNPQQWIIVHTCGPKSTWTIGQYMQSMCSQDHYGLASIGIVAMDA